jgi:hypothetical protein
MYDITALVTSLITVLFLARPHWRRRRGAAKSSTKKRTKRPEAMVIRIRGGMQAVGPDAPDAVHAARHQDDVAAWMACLPAINRPATLPRWISPLPKCFYISIRELADQLPQRNHHKMSLRGNDNVLWDIGTIVLFEAQAGSWQTARDAWNAGTEGGGTQWLRIPPGFRAKTWQEPGPCEQGDNGLPGYAVAIGLAPGWPWMYQARMGRVAYLYRNRMIPGACREGCNQRLQSDRASQLGGMPNEVGLLLLGAHDEVSEDYGGRLADVVVIEPNEEQETSKLFAQLIFFTERGGMAGERLGDAHPGGDSANPNPNQPGEHLVPPAARIHAVVDFTTDPKRPAPNLNAKMRTLGRVGRASDTNPSAVEWHLTHLEHQLGAASCQAHQCLLPALGQHGPPDESAYTVRMGMMLDLAIRNDGNQARLIGEEEIHGSMKQILPATAAIELQSAARAIRNRLAVVAAAAAAASRSKDLRKRHSWRRWHTPGMDRADAWVEEAAAAMRAALTEPAEEAAPGLGPSLAEAEAAVRVAIARCADPNRWLRRSPGLGGWEIEWGARGILDPLSSLGSILMRIVPKELGYSQAWERDLQRNAARPDTAHRALPSSQPAGWYGGFTGTELQRDVSARLIYHGMPWLTLDGDPHPSSPAQELARSARLMLHPGQGWKGHPLSRSPSSYFAIEAWPEDFWPKWWRSEQLEIASKLLDRACARYFIITVSEQMAAGWLAPNGEPANKSSRLGRLSELRPQGPGIDVELLRLRTTGTPMNR